MTLRRPSQPQFPHLKPRQLHSVIPSLAGLCLRILVEWRTSLEPPRAHVCTDLSSVAVTVAFLGGSFSAVLTSPRGAVFNSTIDHGEMHCPSPRGQGLGSPAGKSPSSSVLKSCPVFGLLSAWLRGDAGGQLLKFDTALGAGGAKGSSQGRDK